MDTSEWKILHRVNCDEIEKGGQLCFCCYPLKKKFGFADILPSMGGIRHFNLTSDFEKGWKNYSKWMVTYGVKKEDYPTLKEKINVWKRWVEIRDGWGGDND